MKPATDNKPPNPRVENEKFFRIEKECNWEESITTYGENGQTPKLTSRCYLIDTASRGGYNTVELRTNFAESDGSPRMGVLLNNSPVE